MTQTTITTDEEKALAETVAEWTKKKDRLYEERKSANLKVDGIAKDLKKAKEDASDADEAYESHCATDPRQTSLDLTGPGIDSVAPDMMTAYEEGRTAKREHPKEPAGKLCPYDDPSAAKVAWFRGWFHEEAGAVAAAVVGLTDDELRAHMKTTDTSCHQAETAKLPKKSVLSHDGREWLVVDTIAEDAGERCVYAYMLAPLLTPDAWNKYHADGIGPALETCPETGWPYAHNHGESAGRLVKIGSSKDRKVIGPKSTWLQVNV